MALFGGLPTLNASDSLNAGLVGFWPGNEGAGSMALDLSPARNRGALQNSPGRPISPLGRVVSYAGGGAGAQNINLGTMAAFAAQQTSLSISAWVYPTTLSGSGTIFSQYLYYAGGGELGKMLTSLSGTLTWFCTVAAGGYQTATGPSLTVNTWQHVGVSVSGPTSGPTAVIWVNGTSTSTVLAATGTPRLDVNHRIGASDFSLLGASEAWTGNIGPVRAWMRGITPGDRARITADPWAGLMTRRRVFKAPAADSAIWTPSTVWI